MWPWHDGVQVLGSIAWRGLVNEALIGQPGEHSRTVGANGGTRRNDVASEIDHVQSTDFVGQLEANAAEATTLLPGVEKRAGVGTVFDIPLKHVTDATIRSHHQSIEVRLADAPHPGEIVIALAAAAQGRPQQRLAPLSTEQ